VQVITALTAVVVDLRLAIWYGVAVWGECQSAPSAGFVVLPLIDHAPNFSNACLNTSEFCGCAAVTYCCCSAAAVCAVFPQPLMEMQGGLASSHMLSVDRSVG